jgi:uncharacterized membrane protein YccC
LSDPLVWIKSHRAAFEQALRPAIAGSLAFGITRLFDLPQGLWAAVTAVIVVQGSVDASIKAAVDRFSGTAVEALSGVVITVAIPRTSVQYLRKPPDRDLDCPRRRENREKEN